MKINLAGLYLLHTSKLIYRIQAIVSYIKNNANQEDKGNWKLNEIHLLKYLIFSDVIMI